MRKCLSAAFSTRALLQQEAIVVRVIDDFVTRIGRDGAPETRGLNMTKWYEMVSFDILGEMAFGESFHCIATGSLRPFVSPSCAAILTRSIRKATFLVRTDPRAPLLHHRRRQLAPHPVRREAGQDILSVCSCRTQQELGIQP